MGSYISYYTYTVSKSQRFESYLIGYDDSVIPPEPIYQNDVVVPETMVDGNTLSVPIDGLEPNTAYYIRVQACNRSGCTYKILGPIITWKETAEGVPIQVYYRQDPLTGLLRIWWDSPIIPDSTDLSFSGTYAVSTTVYNQTYIDNFELPPGEYTLVLVAWNGTGDNRIQSGRGNIFGIVVKQHTVGLFYENLIGYEKLSCSVGVSEVELQDTFKVVDSVFLRHPTPFSFDVSSSFAVSDDVNITIITEEIPVEKERVYLIAESVFAVTDTVPICTPIRNVLDCGSTFIVNDMVLVRHPDPSEIVISSSFSVSETVADRSRSFSYQEFNETFTIQDIGFIAPSNTYNVIEYVPLVETYKCFSSTVEDKVEGVLLLDSIHQPPLAETISTEPMRIVDIPQVNKPERSGLLLVDDFEGSEVGQIYDFSHLTSGEG